MISINDFGDAVGLDDDRLPQAHEIFCDEMRTQRKSFAARSMDLATALRDLDVDEDVVTAAVHLLREKWQR